MLQILGALPRCKGVVCLYEIGIDYFLFPASSLEDWTPLGAPCGDDPVVAALKALAEECVHGRGYCRQVLCLYELSKVTPGTRALGQLCWGWGGQDRRVKVLSRCPQGAAEGEIPDPLCGKRPEAS